MKNPHAAALGKLGGKAKSAAKTAASRANGRKGGRPKNALHVFRSEHGECNAHAPSREAAEAIIREGMPPDARLEYAGTR